MAVGVDIALEVHRITGDFPKSEQYGLASQLRRAAVSIASNIAEGHARRTQKERQRFVNIAKGSLAELETQLIIAKELGFADGNSVAALFAMADKESKMLSGLMRSIKDTI